MARGKPDLNGAPSSSGTPRPGSNYTNVEGPGHFKGQSKKVPESSGTIRSTGPKHAASVRSARQASELGPDLKDTWHMSGGGIAAGPPRASKNTDVSANVKQNELGNAHGASPIAGAPPKAR